MKRLAMIMMCIALMMLQPVCSMAEGLIVTITSDQQRYELDDVAYITIDIENKTGKNVKNLNLLHHLPDGLTYAEDWEKGKMFIAKLDDGDTAQIQIAVKKEIPKLAVKIRADKKVYGDSDIAELTAVVENMSENTIKNIDLTHILPNGLVHANGTSGKVHVVDSLAAYETAEVKLYVQKAVFPPKTGEEALPVIFWWGTASVSCLTFILLNRKERKV